MLESSARRPSTAAAPGGVSGACPGRVEGRGVSGAGRVRGGASWRAIEAGDPGAAGEDSGRAAGPVSPSPPLHCAAQDPPEVGDGARVHRHRGEEPSRAGASQDRTGPERGALCRGAAAAQPAPSTLHPSRTLRLLLPQRAGSCRGVPPASAPRLPAAQVCPAERCRRVPGRAGPPILRGGPGGGRGERPTGLRRPRCRERPRGPDAPALPSRCHVPLATSPGLKLAPNFAGANPAPGRLSEPSVPGAERTRKGLVLAADPGGRASSFPGTPRSGAPGSLAERLFGTASGLDSPLHWRNRNQQVAGPSAARRRPARVRAAPEPGRLPPGAGPTRAAGGAGRAGRRRWPGRSRPRRPRCCCCWWRSWPGARRPRPRRPCARRSRCPCAAASATT